MSVKGFIDAARRYPGYDGTAVFVDNSLIFIEGMDEAYASKFVDLYGQLSVIFGPVPSSLMLESGHHTISIVSIGGMKAIVRTYGRHEETALYFNNDTEYVDMSSLSTLPSKASASSEAALILKRLGF